MSEAMKAGSRATLPACITRRDFIGIFIGAGAALTLIPAVPLPAALSIRSRQPVVSFHMDQPYLDWSGTAMPYYPPPGIRSGQIVANFYDESLRFQHCYL
jgi:hypothetical protein